MQISTRSQHVFYASPGEKLEDTTSPGGWYYWDEAGLLGGGPFATEDEAIAALDAYARNL